MVATKRAYQAALDRAADMGGPRMIVSRSANRRIYRVRCLTGCTQAVATHPVVVKPDGELACGCPAGLRDHPCVHAAAVWIERVAEGRQYPGNAYQTREEGQQAASGARTLPGEGAAPPEPLSSIYATRRPLGDDDGSPAVWPGR